VPSVAGNVVVLALQGHGGAIDTTPLGFLVSGLLIGYAVFRMGVLRLVPVARDHVVETMSDGVFVLDPAGVVLDLNPAARRMLADVRPEVGSEIVGRTLGAMAGTELLAALQAAGAPGTGRVLEIRPGLHLDVRTTPVADARGQHLGRITVVRDVSDSQARHAAVEALNRQLAAQLEVIEKLKAGLAEEAVRDHLTGLYNRRHLDRILADALAGAAAGDPVGVVLLDVDHFKSVNDRYGHAVGDQVLRGVAGVLRASTRPGDTIARLGGEEFVIVLPGADREQARLRAETVRRACGLWDHPVPDGILRVTVSAGVAAGPADGLDGTTLLEACDRALYAAKEAGRDRVLTVASALVRSDR
jgi:diguanylate cyclase (GGDEF)-like protein